MRALVALVATALSLALPGNAAHAAAGPGRAVPCDYTSVTNQFDTERQVGYLGGAAVVIADGADPRTGRLVCSVQWGLRHADPDLVSHTSATTAGVVTMPAMPFEYVHDDDFGYLPRVCTAVEIDGAGTFYLDAETRRWTTSPLASCRFLGYGDNWPFDVIESYGVYYVVEDEVDPVVCPLLAGQAPGAGPVAVEPDGDLSVSTWDVWDCPPYDDAYLTDLDLDRVTDDVNEFVDEEVDPVFSDLNAFIEEEVDPVVCPLLAGLAPGAGPVVVEPEGDVYAADTFVWDCPPYDASR
ncbi:MAG TPA: hypothetical protein VNQ77_14015 [Frankiaceae bacterium]|nr:hypothetical protein [Frankiaceae bacterium]